MSTEYTQPSIEEIALNGEFIQATEHGLLYSYSFPDGSQENFLIRNVGSDAATTRPKATGGNSTDPECAEQRENLVADSTEMLAATPSLDSAAFKRRRAAPRKSSSKRMRNFESNGLNVRIYIHEHQPNVLIDKTEEDMASGSLSKQVSSFYKKAQKLEMAGGLQTFIIQVRKTRKNLIVHNGWFGDFAKSFGEGEVGQEIVNSFVDLASSYYSEEANGDGSALFSVASFINRIRSKSKKIPTSTSLNEPTLMTSVEPAVSTNCDEQEAEVPSDVSMVPSADQGEEEAPQDGTTNSENREEVFPIAPPKAATPKVIVIRRRDVSRIFGTLTQQQIQGDPNREACSSIQTTAAIKSTNSSSQSLKTVPQLQTRIQTVSKPNTQAGNLILAKSLVDLFLGGIFDLRLQGAERDNFIVKLMEAAREGKSYNPATNEFV